MNKKDVVLALTFWVGYTSIIAGLYAAAANWEAHSIIGGTFFVIISSCLITALTVGSQNKDRDD